MSTTKLVSGDYTIQSLNGNVRIIGNLIVAGNTSAVSSTDTSIVDNIITLNAGEVGAGVSLGYAGVEIDRGALDNVEIRWNEATAQWQYTNDGITYVNLSAASGGGLTAVVLDTAPALGGNLNIGNKTIYSSTKNLILSMGTVGSGGSGLYVGTPSTANVELATTSKSIVYGIIFS
jgi:hypothetical protein